MILVVVCEHEQAERCTIMLEHNYVLCTLSVLDCSCRASLDSRPLGLELNNYFAHVPADSSGGNLVQGKTFSIHGCGFFNLKPTQRSMLTQ